MPNTDAAQKAVRGLIRSRGPAPVHLWDPPFCGNIDLRIDRNGDWHHEGRPITRPAMVRLFANVLKREGDAYFLVTPVEKVGITVDDVPFVITKMHEDGDRIVLTTSLGDEAPLSALRMAGGVPYAPVRGGMEGRIDRKTFYRLAERGEVEGDAFGLRSGGAFVGLCPAGDLDL
ncbi:DUF1285 domain-containing protein [Falsirhodobacter sp. 20TX0035]|nr:DUF1285 domain-containing protein [Falsirhodobacter sp. 20TX0035]MDB6452246.1 DUF1285 domain-containing protein [Falsirhodobacter sp. 20TX0035]